MVAFSDYVLNGGDGNVPLMKYMEENNSVRYEGGQDLAIVITYFADLFWLHLVQEYPEMLSEELSFEKLKECLAKKFQEETVSAEMAKIFFNAAGLDEEQKINVEQTSRLAKLKHMETFSNVFRILNSDLSGIKDTEHIVDEMIGKEDDSTPTFTPVAGMPRNFTRNATWFGTDSDSASAMEVDYAVLKAHE